MNIQNPEKDLSGSKTLKVSIPKKLHLHLHSRKLLTGTNISETVEKALLSYLDTEADASEMIAEN